MDTFREHVVYCKDFLLMRCIIFVVKHVWIPLGSMLSIVRSFPTLNSVIILLEMSFFRDQILVYKANFYYT